MNAVRIDSSVILFDCGKSMRVGIRHRRTQTLYLSGLIVPSSLDGPPYGKIMGGLYLAIAHDLATRYAQLREKAGKTQTHKRSRGSEDTSDGTSTEKSRGQMPNRGSDDAKQVCVLVEPCG